MLERHLQLVFAETCRALRADCQGDALETLLFELDRICRSVAPAVWEDAVQGFCRNHPILDMLLEDPYTREAYFRRSEPSKDAAVFDWVLHPNCPPSTTRVGQRIFERTTRRVGGPSIEHRCETLAAAIDQTASAGNDVRIAMVGCGKLRELCRVGAESWPRVRSLLVIDDQPANVGFVRRHHPQLPLESLYANVDYLLRERPALPPQDLVCICGWCDYLDRERARLLSVHFADSLRQGGRLIVTHLAPDSAGRGYMEAFMNWRREYRDEQQVCDFVVGNDLHRFTDVQLARDTLGNMVYLTAQVP